MPDKITQLLDDIDRLDQAATPGPWQVTTDIDDDGGLFPWAIFGPKNDIYGPQGRDQENYIQEIPELTIPDAELIALSRTALPALSRAVRAVLKECKEAHERYASDRYDVDREGQARMAEIVEDALTDALKGAGND